MGRKGTLCWFGDFLSDAVIQLFPDTPERAIPCSTANSHSCHPDGFCGSTADCLRFLSRVQKHNYTNYEREKIIDTEVLFPNQL